MLVIKRKVSESILIGDDIEIIISEISQDKVKIAISAPQDIKITRKELAETCEFNKIASEKINEISLNDIKNKLKAIKN
ncbi:MAG TPA: carbon storage regulator [Sedimentibacter sp.]|jgi:carbon storage regulator|nr:carbon storage regulator [Sedimentibacter sp.]NLA12922.1 carbon storage regulator [Tissierellia bacterium]HOA19706.1 carbon storage regulator [Sedimentibacter sp.]HOG63280.1 carbon storage regulator [Sedimentibacter sp.]HOT21130.1 carbon storage regulator [Sedimentibacter sp.]